MKRLWLDVETTGLDPEKNGIIQIGALIEIEGEFVESFTEEIRPFDADEISTKALEVSGRTDEEIADFLDPQIAYEIFVGVLRRYVDRFNSKDKFMLAGYSCKFDDAFMRQWFIKNDDKFWGSYVKRQMLDLYPVMIFLRELGLVKAEDVKLATVCKLFNIKLDAHDAFSDAKAAYELYCNLNSILKPDWDEGVRWDILNASPIDIESGPFDGGI